MLMITDTDTGYRAPLADWLDANADDTDTCALLAGMVSGQTLTLGGGAVADCIVRASEATVSEIVARSLECVRRSYC